MHGNVAQFNEEKLMEIAGQSAAVASLHAWKQVRELVNGPILPMVSGSKIILSFSKARNVPKVPRVTVRSVASSDGHLRTSLAQSHLSSLLARYWGRSNTITFMLL